eukprot:1140422-Pelagomonas_calceolata.AAC.3
MQRRWGSIAVINLIGRGAMLPLAVYSQKVTAGIAVGLVMERKAGITVNGRKADIVVAAVMEKKAGIIVNIVLQRN